MSYWKRQRRKKEGKKYLDTNVYDVSCFFYKNLISPSNSLTRTCTFEVVQFIILLLPSIDRMWS